MSKEHDDEDDTLKHLLNSDVYDAINTQFLDDDFDGKGGTLIGSMYGNQLKEIEEFVERVESSGDLAFEVSGKTCKELPHAATFYRMPGFLGQEEWGWSYSPRVQLFYEAAKELPAMRFKYPLAPSIGGTEADVFNRFIEHLRKLCGSARFKDQLRQQGFRTSRRYRKLKAYVEKLFSLYSRLLVVRIDLLYHGEDVSLEQAQGDFARLVNNRRHNKIFEHLVGSIKRLEFGAVRDHHHFHVVFFFDGAEVRNDVYLAEQIGQYWKKVTGGKGHYHNCNREKVHRYRRVGIGMISHDDWEKRENLLLALAYLTKKDQLLWVKGDQKVRAIECGRLIGREHSGRGRPRRNKG